MSLTSNLLEQERSNRDAFESSSKCSLEQMNDYYQEQMNELQQQHHQHEVVHSDETNLSSDEQQQQEEQPHRDRRRSSLQILDMKLIHSLSNQYNNDTNGPINGPEGVCECEKLTTLSLWVLFCGISHQPMKYLAR